MTPPNQAKPAKSSYAGLICAQGQGVEKSATENKQTRAIYEYEDYRSYLRDFFSAQKESNKNFTHRYFAKMAGFSSSSFCLHVMNGRKNISGESIQKFIIALGLKGKAARYFEALIRYNQNKKLYDRELYFSQLNKIRRGTKFYRVNKRQFVLYSEWYFSVIRELAVHSDWNGDYRRLGNMVVPPLSEEKTKKAVETLIDVGLLIKNDYGTLRQNFPVVSAQAAPAFVVNKLKKDFLFKALEAEEKFRKPAKYSSSATLSMSMRSFEKAKVMIDDVRQALLTMAMNDMEVDQVFQVNFQMFPLSGPIKKSLEVKNASLT
jgi:uncharacterized protein (TIGR02147 family)